MENMRNNVFSYYTWKLGTFVLIILLLFGVGIVSAKISITASGEIPRCVINPGEDLYGQFKVQISPDSKYTGPYAVSIFKNPMTITGDYCDRPPYFADQLNLVYGTVGDREVIPPIDRGNLEVGTNFAVIKEFFPTPDNYASKGCWDIPWDGERYMAYVPVSGTYLMNTTYPSEYGTMGLKPGEYTIHVQQIFAPGDPTFDKDAFAETNVTVNYGDLSVGLYELSSYVKDKDVAVTNYSLGSDEKIVIKGKNTDSFKSYIWITGPGLPECGTGLQHLTTLPVKSFTPEVLTLPINPWGNDKNPGAYHKFIETALNSGKYTGEWEYIWDINKLGLSPGNYTVYVSSVNPAEVLTEYCKGDISCKPDCLMNTPCSKGTGVCALQSCARCCSPPIASASFAVLKPKPIVVDSIPDIEICCNDKYPCGSFNSELKIPVKGNLGLSRLPFQVWLFGNNMIGGNNGYLFADNFKSYLDNDGSFELELNKDLLQPNDICACDMSPGTYYVVIQTPNQQRLGKELFSVTLENSTWFNQVEDPIKPGYQESKIGEWKYVVESKPVFWSRSFPIEGPEADVNYDGFYKLIDTLAKYDDPYRILTFNLTDSCTKYVDFSTSPGYGVKPLTVQFTDKSQFTDVVGKTWDFGDGTTSTLQNPEHVYKNAGLYTVKLTLSRVEVESSVEKYHNIYVKNTDLTDGSTVKDLSADFRVIGSNTGSPPLTVQFIDTSVGEPVGWNWNFGDGSFATEQSPQHSYRREDVYTVNLTVYDRYGDEDTVSKPGLVKVDSSSIKASFRYAPDMTNIRKLQFEDISTGEGINQWTWSFGDGSGTAYEQNPVYTFAENGCYPVTLKIENNVASDVRSYRICI